MAARLFAKQTRKEASTAAQLKKPIPKYIFEGHEETIWSFVFLHDNIHIVSGSGDGTMRKWNCDTGLVVGRPWEGDGRAIYALALSPDGKIIACGRGNGSVQRWTTDGKMIEGVWTGRNGAVRSLSWSPSGRQITSGSDDGIILTRNVESGKVEVGPIKVEQSCVCSLAYSPSGNRIALGEGRKISIWDTQTSKRVVGPIKDLGNDVTSLVWSSDGTKLYSASDNLARAFDSKSGQLLHHFKHNNLLWSVALSPENDVLACVNLQGVAQLWDTESHQRLGQPFHQNDVGLCYVTFSRDGRHLVYGGSDKKLTLWMLKDVTHQLSAPTPPQQSDKRSTPQKSDGQSTQQEIRPNSPSSSCLDADATGGGGFFEEADDDPYNNFFQSSQQSLPSPYPGFHFPSLFLARYFLNVISRCRPPPDESVPQERSGRGFFSRRARSNSSLELATTKPKQSVPERKVGDSEGEQGGNVDDGSSAHDLLNVTMDKGKQRDDSPVNAQSPPSYGRTLPAPLDNKDSQGLWEWLMQARGKKITFGFLHSSTPPVDAPQPALRNPWHWNSSSFPVGSSRRPVDIAACRDEDRYGITPETDKEAAAAMLRTNDDVADSSMRQGQPVVVVRVSQGRPIQTQASTSGTEEIGVSCCGFFFGCRRLSNSHQP